MLADDEEPLSVRGAALREWCQRFLDGLSAAGGLSGDCREIVDDITRMAGQTISGVDGDEDEEAAFVEIVEYLRVGVLLIHEQRQGVKRATGWPEGVN
ncbi:MAG: UPF0149 family protein [Gammaproteobacteria bacterium]|nr:UPF0149 family protein [Gammaproteobacteria bacterium]MCI0590487.1 UPF0149 family protein [Gammaproteobacteria bacterium]